MSKENRPEKNGFLLYKTQWEPLHELDDEDLGALMRAIFEYQIEGVEPSKKSPIAAYFKFIKAQFSIDEGGYQVVVEKRRLAGIASAEAKKKAKEEAQQTSTKSTHVESVEQNQQTPTNATKSTDKDKENEKEKDNVKDNGKELSNESIGAGGLFHEKIIAFIEAYGSAGNRHDTERKYIEAITTLKGDGWPENNAHKMLIEKAAQYRVFRIQTQRKPKDPANWLKDRTWTTDYVQEMENFKIENSTKEKNGKSTRADEARAYTDAARQHADDSGL